MDRTEVLNLTRKALTGWPGAEVHAFVVGGAGSVTDLGKVGGGQAFVTALEVDDAEVLTDGKVDLAKLMGVVDTTLASLGRQEALPDPDAPVDVVREEGGVKTVN